MCDETPIHSAIRTLGAVTILLRDLERLSEHDKDVIADKSRALIQHIGLIDDQPIPHALTNVPIAPEYGKE